jgi:predicted DNA-binding protein with PD1-like motif
MTAAAANPLRALSLRLGPGEDVCEGLAAALDRAGARGGVVASAVGSLAAATYALVTFDDEGKPAYTDRRRIEGSIELLGLQGHFGRTADGASAFHLHGSFGLADGRVVGGHVLGATVLVTFEATLLVGAGAEWSAVPYRPEGDDVPVPENRRMNVFLPAGPGAP